MTLNQQITWLTDQLRYMKSALPKLVESGRLAEADATHRMACANASLQTLTQLRGIVGGKEFTNGCVNVAPVALLHKMLNEADQIGAKVISEMRAAADARKGSE